LRSEGMKEDGDVHMSAGELELMPVVEEMVAAAFGRDDQAAEEAEIKEIAQACVEMCVCDVAEIYAPPRFAAHCGRLGMVPGFCVDLATRKANGEFWDLTKEPDCEELERTQAREQPRLVIGPPPCATFCPLLRIRQTEKEVEKRQRRNENRMSEQRWMRAGGS
jgi:hypothetical protein